MLCYSLAYQKLLNWEPLLELVKMESSCEGHTFLADDTLEMELVVRFHGPKV